MLDYLYLRLQIYGPSWHQLYHLSPIALTFPLLGYTTIAGGSLQLLLCAHPIIVLGLQCIG